MVLYDCDAEMGFDDMKVRTYLEISPSDVQDTKMKYLFVRELRFH